MKIVNFSKLPRVGNVAMEAITWNDRKADYLLISTQDTFYMFTNFAVLS